MKFSVEKIINVLDGLLVSPAAVNNPNDFFSVTNDSRKAGPNIVFVAIAGFTADGHDFIPEAIANGTRLIIHQKQVHNDRDASFIRVNDSYAAYARLAELSCGFPARNLELIGITGTNGKTTTAFLVRSILEQAGEKCGLISTIEYAYPGKSITAERTTPDALELQQLLGEIRNSGCKYAVMEVSSHALDQQRTGSAKFATAAFTNLSGEHLDYHHDMESYFLAKKRLFESHLKKDAYAVINADDEFGRRLLIDYEKNISFGRAGELKTIEFNTSFSGTEVSLQYHNQNFILNSPLYGDYNAYNIAAAAGIALALQINMEAISKGIGSMMAVPGRLEGFKLPSGALALVDYAHTDDAMKNVLATLLKLKEGVLTVVFGCGGDRDRSKRARMGAVAADFADKIIVTSDNPRSESPEEIIKEICTGIPENALYEVHVDREFAIIKAIRNAQKGDIVLIAGKGHENYQEIKGQKYPFDDREIIRNFIAD